jgi:nuclear transport factor 2 (NTF2) superfamily protein
MKKKVKVEFEFCFDHSKGNLYEACGVNEEAVKEFLSKGILQYIKETNIEDEEATKLSRVVEWTVKNAPSDYLMFLLSKDLRNVIIDEIIEKQKN